MSYTPQTKWINDSHPMYPPEPVSPKATRSLSKVRVVRFLKATPWQTAEQIASALDSQAEGLRSADKTLCRMAQRGVIMRARSGGRFVFGPIT